MEQVSGFSVVSALSAAAVQSVKWSVVRSWALMLCIAAAPLAATEAEAGAAGTPPA